jgi:hypothetical protein
MATCTAALLASGCGAAERASAPQPATTVEQAAVRGSDQAAPNHTPPLCPRPAAGTARITTRERAEAALRAAMAGVDCGAKSPLVCPRPTSVPTRPRVPTLEEAETTLRAAMQGVECDADAALAAQTFLELTASGRQDIRPDDLHITDQSLPACTDDHLPEKNEPTTPEEAEAMPDPPAGAECDASRGGTVTLCKGRHTNCVVVGEYTGPPVE